MCWLAAACGTPPPCDAVAVERAPILGGAEATDDPAVVALQHADGATYCTGTLIGPALVISAAHCVIDDDGGVRAPVAVVTDGGVRVGVAWVAPHPGYHHRYFLDDLALIGLAAPLAVAPRRIGAADAVDEVRLVGFGRDAPDRPGGTRRTASAPVMARDARNLAHAPLTCNGDSGGAAFATQARGGAIGARASGGVLDDEVLVAVISHGPSGCTSPDGLAFAVRVDAASGWIAEITSATASPQADGRCVTGAASDPDCTCASDGRCQPCADGRVDVDCGLAAAGAACDAAQPCERGTSCVDGTCWPLCNVELHGCPLGFACSELDDGGDGVCLAVEAGCD